MSQTTTIPALSQSRQNDMACPRLYVEKHVLGNQGNPSPESLRGSQIHDIIKRYVYHLVRIEKPTDWGHFDQLTAELAHIGDAANVLDDFKHSFTLSFDDVLWIEQRLYLDADFIPTIPSMEPAVYEGTPDLVYMPARDRAIIDDWKSYYGMVDADTFQSKYYPLLVMCQNPEILEVEFRLQFVRFGTYRSVTYTRDDLPKLKRLAAAARARQKSLHEFEELGASHAPAIPGQHCTYCPLMQTHKCPLGDANPMATMTMEDRLRYVVYLNQARKFHMARLKEHVFAEGPVEIRDDNDTASIAKFDRQTRTKYPLPATVGVLADWFKTTGEDLTPKLFISSTALKGYAKAKKRVDLAEQLKTAGEDFPGTRFVISGDEDADGSQD